MQSLRVGVTAGRFSPKIRPNRFLGFSRGFHFLVIFATMNGLIESVARNTLKRARRGLFGNTGKLFGNNVSHSERKCV